MQGKEKKQQIWTGVLMVIYLAVIIWIVLFKMARSFQELPKLSSINLIPYGESVIVNGKMDFGEIIQNILVFVPFGMYLSMLKPKWGFWKRLLPAAGISLAVEILQYVFAIGASDITDLIGNTLGGAAGIGIVCLLRIPLREKTNCVLNILATVCTVCMLALVILLNVLN